MIWAIVLLAVSVAGVALLVLRTQKRQEETLRELADRDKNNPALQLLQTQINHLREEVSKSREELAKNLNRSIVESARIMAESQKTVGERLDKAAQVVGQVQKSLGSLDQKAQQIFDVGKDIATLQEILRAPKLRGVLGELSLGDLLSQILPPKHFTLQHTFKTGETVDAVVRIGGRLVPVDSKFPFENFQKMIQAPTPEEKAGFRRKFVGDVKKHIDSIASKYILPDEGTFDFALMYIMAENVYYETIIKDENMGEEKSLVQHAFSRRVIPVSPNSFYAYLHTISLGLRGLQIEENAKLILEQMARLRGDFSRFRDEFDILGKHITNTRTKYEDADKRLIRFGDKLEGLEGPGTKPALPPETPAPEDLPKLMKTQEAESSRQ